MTNATHGGPRPATREDDGRHANGGHSGTGPKPKSFTLKLNDSYAGWHGKVWTVIAIDRTAVTLQSTDGDKFTLFR